MILALPSRDFAGTIRKHEAGAGMGSGERDRLDFGHWVDRVFWGLMVAVALYASTQLKALSESVSNLNEKMAVVVEKINYSEKRQDADERRLDRLEDYQRNHR